MKSLPGTLGLGHDNGPARRWLPCSLGVPALVLCCIRPSLETIVGGVACIVGVGLAFSLASVRRAWRLADRGEGWGLGPASLRVIGVGAALFILQSGISRFVRTFAVESFRIPAGSMLPTLLVGDQILVDKFTFGPLLLLPGRSASFGRLPGRRRPQPGDVIVFIYPKNRDQDFIKRVAAVEGETIEVRAQHVFVNGVPRDDPGCVAGLPGSSEGDFFGPFVVPADHVFVMGDNRRNSYDSRFWGPVPLPDVKGLARSVYFSDGDNGIRWDRIGRAIQ